MSFYVASLHLEGKQWGTCKQYSNTILRLLRKAGFKIDNSTWSIFTAARKGFKKTRPPKQDKRLPITPKVLEQFLPHLDLEHTHDDRVFWGTACPMVYGLFRCAELTADGDSPCFPRERDFTPVRGAETKAANLHLPQSKTDILSQGVDVPLVANDSLTCPLKAIAAMKEGSPLHAPFPESPLFRLEDGSPVSGKWFRKRIKELVQKANLGDGQKYTAHSCRRGGAQALFDAGVPPTHIKIIGRWKSNSFLHYIGVTLDQMLRSSALMSTAQTSLRLAFASF
jgi:hypothetical protein